MRSSRSPSFSGIRDNPGRRHSGRGVERQFLRDGQREGKGRAVPRAVAADGERAAEFPGGVGASVEAEAVAVFFVVKPWLKMRVRFSGGMRMPLSVTSTSTRSPLPRAMRSVRRRSPGRTPSACRALLMGLSRILWRSNRTGKCGRGGSRPRPGPRCGRSGAAYGNNPRLCFASATR